MMFMYYMAAALILFSCGPGLGSGSLPENRLEPSDQYSTDSDPRVQSSPPESPSEPASSRQRTLPKSLDDSMTGSARSKPTSYARALGQDHSSSSSSTWGGNGHVVYQPLLTPHEVSSPDSLSHDLTQGVKQGQGAVKGVKGVVVLPDGSVVQGQGIGVVQTHKGGKSPALITPSQKGQGSVGQIGKGGQFGGAQSSLRYRAGDIKIQHQDILWVVENGSSMKRLKSYHRVAQAVRFFIRKYARPDYQIALMSAQTKDAKLCVPRIYARDLDMGWAIDMSLVKSSFIAINCAIETLSALHAASVLFSGGSLAGGAVQVGIKEFVRPQSQLTVVVVSDGFSFDQDSKSFKQAVFSHYPEHSVSFYSFSSTGIDPQKTSAITLSPSSLTPKYADRQQTYYYGDCGHLYTSTYGELSQLLGGRLFGFCQNNWDSDIKQMMSDLAQKSYQQFYFKDLIGQSISLQGVKVDGVITDPSAYVWGTQDGLPTLWFKSPQIFKPNSIIEIVIQ